MKGKLNVSKKTTARQYSTSREQFVEQCVGRMGSHQRVNQANETKIDSF